MEVDALGRGRQVGLRQGVVEKAGKALEQELEVLRGCGSGLWKDVMEVERVGNVGVLSG